MERWTSQRCHIIIILPPSTSTLAFRSVGAKGTVRAGRQSCSGDIDYFGTLAAAAFAQHGSERIPRSRFLRSRPAAFSAAFSINMLEILAIVAFPGISPTSCSAPDGARKRLTTTPSARVQFRSLEFIFCYFRKIGLR